MNLNDALEEYERKRTMYESFAKSLKDLLEKFLLENNLRFHSISCRVKDKVSLEKKMRDKKCKKLSEITDIIGLRIITHYADEVDLVGSIIEGEFEIDRENTIDKRAILEPDRFGYLSLHYIVSLDSKRTRLSEYKGFRGIKAELQVRSILQHTWAEIEHDIGYKTSIELPKELRRQFSRLAGLLEIADSEFKSIRLNLDNYQRKVQASIKDCPENLLLDGVSLLEFVESDDLVNLLNAKISEITGFSYYSPSERIISSHLTGLKKLNIESIQLLKQALKDNKNIILQRAKDVGSEPGSVPQSVCIFYLEQILFGRLKDKGAILEWFREISLGEEDEQESFADYLIQLGRITK